MKHRSTTLKLAARHCPRALDHYEAGASFDRRAFEAGIACHAILQAIGENRKEGGGPEDYDRICDAVVEQLVTAGRTFDGVPEPPLSVDAALAGRKLARDWFGQNPLDPDPEAHYEIGIAVDRDWQLVPYGSPEHWYGQIIDFACLRWETLSDSRAAVLHVRDYKTSWSAGESLLDSIQLRGAGVLAHIAAEAGALGGIKSYGLLRREVVNVRLGRSFIDELDASEAAYKVERWRKDVEIQCRALETRGPDGLRVAAPGGGCLGCPYVLSCDPGRRWRAGTSAPSDPWELAVAYATAAATAKALRDLVEPETDEGMIDLRDGWAVGTVARFQMGPTEQAYAKAWEAWAAGNGEPRGFAKALRLGTGNLRALAGARWPGKDGFERRERFLAEVLTPAAERRFGIHPIDTKEGGDDGA